MYYLCSYLSLREAAECPVPPKPFRPPPLALDRSGRGMRRRAGRRGPDKNVAGVADNPLISPDSPPKMEGIGSDFFPFLSSRTHFGSVDDAFLKSPGARPEANAAFSRGLLRECLLAARSARKWRRIGLKRLIPRPRMVWPPQDLASGASGAASASPVRRA